MDIAQVVIEFFKRLPPRGKPIQSEATVLVAFVLTDSQSARVVTINVLGNLSSQLKSVVLTGFNRNRKKHQLTG